MTRVPDPICRARKHRQFCSLRAELKRDVTRLIHHVHGADANDRSIKRRIAAAMTPQVLSLAIHRLAHLLHASGWRGLATALARLNFVLHKLDIHPSSCIAAGCLLPHPPGVSFVGLAGTDLTLYSLSACCADPVDHAGAPTLGDRVMLGGHAIVLGPVHVGDDVKIAPNVRIDRDVPAGTIAISRNTRVGRGNRINHQARTTALENNVDKASLK